MKKFLLVILIGIILAPQAWVRGAVSLTSNLRITVCNGSDCGDDTPPSVPTNLVVTAVTTSQINLSWDASIDPGSPASGVSGYAIYRNGGASAIATTTGTSYSDTGLSSGTLYSYSVLAYDAILNESAQSSTVSTTTISIPSNAPVPSNGSPSGSLAAGTTQTTVSLDTDIAATCRYGTTAGTAYVGIPNTFGTTGGTSHSTIVAGLANGITKTLYVRCQSSTNVPMTSDYVISFSIASPSSSSSGGGGGGGAGSPPSPVNPANQVNVIVRGIAYPGSRVSLLKDGQTAATTQSGPDARFEVQLSGVGEGTFTFSVWAMDKNGIRSALYPFTVTLTSGATTVISGVFIPPTVSLEYETVKRGDPLRVIGQSAPQAKVSVIFHSDTEIIEDVSADAQGLWTYALDTLRLDYGDHTTQARSVSNKDISTLSKLVSFKVGTENVVAKKEVQASKSDMNGDNRVDLADFSIMLFWYKRTLTGKSPAGVDLNKDGKVDLVDFSIFAYNWTG